MNFEADGVTLRVEATGRSSPDLWRAVERHLDGFPPSMGSPEATLHLDEGDSLSLHTTTAAVLEDADRRWIPYLDPVTITETGYIHVAVGRFIDMASLYFADRSAVRIHAACLVDADDRCWVIVGPSGSGKSTLSLAMAASGAQYVTDERVTVRTDVGGPIVSGLPRPIHLRDPSTSVSSSTFGPFAAQSESDGFRDLVFLDQISGGVAATLIRPTGLVALGDWPADTTRATIARFLVEQSFDAVRTGPPALLTIAELAAHCEIYLVPERSIGRLEQLPAPHFPPGTASSVMGDPTTVALDGELLVWVDGTPPTIIQLSDGG